MSAACRSCSGRCCCDMLVPVTAFDIERIARRQNLPSTAFLEPCLDDEPGAQSVRLDTSEDRYQIKLRQGLAEDGACGFLTLPSEGQRLCGIYVDRPIVCAAYPFVASADGVALMAGARCKADDWELSVLDVRAVRSVLGRYAASCEGDATIVAVWNEAVDLHSASDPFETYCAYARLAVERFRLERDEVADSALLEGWIAPGQSAGVRFAQRAWLADLERYARAAHAESRLRRDG